MARFLPAGQVRAEEYLRQRRVDLLADGYEETGATAS
jgi:hypothetical protein